MGSIINIQLTCGEAANDVVSHVGVLLTSPVYCEFQYVMQPLFRGLKQKCVGLKQKCVLI